MARFCIVLCRSTLLLALAATAIAQTTVTPRNSAQPSGPVPTATPAPGAESATGKKDDYSQQPSIIQKLINRYQYESDGTGSHETIFQAKIQNQLGVQQYGEVQLGYNAENEHIKINYVRVRKPTGVLVPAQLDLIQDLTAPVAEQAPVYSDLKIKHVVVPSLQPGDTLEYDIVVETFKPLVANQFWVVHDFVTQAIVLDEELEVNIPEKEAAKLETQTGFEAKTSTEKGRHIYRWQRQNLALEDDDAKDADGKKKKHPRRDPDRRPDVQITTFKSWEEVGAWYAGLQKDRIQPDDMLKARANELTKGQKTDLEKIEALYDFVATQYRYVSLSFGLSRYQPHAASEVLNNRYGDCKDKHTLLAALLKAEGFDPHAVLMNSSRKIDEDSPSPGQFDHVITAVPLAGKLIWLDTTAEVAPFQVLSPVLRKKKGLFVDESEPSRLVETPAQSPETSRDHFTITGEINQIGKLSANVQFSLRGDSELYFRQAFRQTPQDRWKQLTESINQMNGLGGEVDHVDVSDPAKTREPMQIDYAVVRNNFLDWTNKSTELTLPMPENEVPDFPDPDDQDKDTKDKALDVPGAPLDSKATVILTFPKDYTLRLPLAVDLKRDYAEYHSKYTLEGNKLIAEREMKFNALQIPMDRRSEYLAFRRTIRADEAQTLGIETGANGSTPIPEGMKADDLEQAGFAALKNGNYHESIELFKRVVQAEPKRKEGWNYLGRAYFGAFQLDDAVSAFRKQIELDPYDESAYGMLGAVLQYQNKYDEAIAAYQKQIEVNPLDDVAHARLGGLYLDRKRYAEAVPELEKAVSIQPKDAYLEATLGRAYLNVNQPEKASAAFDRAIELSPSPSIWNNIAYELSQHDMQLDKAQTYAESACAAVSASLRNADLNHLSSEELGMVDSLAADWDTLGWIYFKRNQLDKAEKYISAAWSVSQHSEIGDHLAQIYEKRGKREDAVRLYALAAAGLHPTPDVNEHFRKAAGNEATMRSALAKAKVDLEDMRTIRLGKVLKTADSAEFFVLLLPDASVQQAKFISGNQDLKKLESSLMSAKYPPAFAFPQDWPAKIIRRGVLSCSGTGGCTFVLQEPETVTSVN